jgi:hypothetical protein
MMKFVERSPHFYSKTMPNISKSNHFSTPDLIRIDRHDEVKSRCHPYHQTSSSSDEMLPPPAQQFPAPARFAGKGMAMQLRRSVSMQALAGIGSRNENKAPESLQVLWKGLKALNDYVAEIKFKPDEQRHQIRRKVMKAEIHELELDKSLERIFYAIYKAKNELKPKSERSSDEEIFTKAVWQAIRFSKSRASSTVFKILKNEYKSKNGMGDTAASITAGASLLALPFARALHTLTPTFVHERNEKQQRQAKLAADMDALRRNKERSRLNHSDRGLNSGIDRDPLFDTPRGSTSIDNETSSILSVRGVKKSPAEIFNRIGALVKNEGVAAALSKMDVDDAIVLSEFKGDINHLSEMMGLDLSAESRAGISGSQS